MTTVSIPHLALEVGSSVQERNSPHGKMAAATTLPIRRPLLGILTAAAVLLGIALIPILLVEIPPLADYPNHMARMHILADAGRSPVLTHIMKSNGTFCRTLPWM